MIDAKKLKWGYFAELKFIGAKESDERRIEAEKTMQEVHDLRFQEWIRGHNKYMKHKLCYIMVRGSFIKDSSLRKKGPGEAYLK